MRLVDKVLPQLARLATEFLEPCSPTIHVQADASRDTPDNIARVFNHPDVPGGKWDYVFNLGGETAYSQTYEIYKLRSYQLSETLANECARRGVGAYVEASTGMVYSPSRSPRKETDKLKPWTKMGKVALEIETMLSKIPSLNLVILRLPHVYGEYDTGIIGTALCLARIHQAQNRELKWLWTAELRQNTVHVEDCARALWHAAIWRTTHSTIPSRSTSSSPTFTRRSTFGSNSSNSNKPDDAPPLSTPIFNIVDHNDSSQGSLSALLTELFSIPTSFSGTLISQLARLNLDKIVDETNEEMLGPWAEMLESQGLKTGPLGPWLEKELLKDADLSLDGGLFESITGFEYQKPRFSVDEGRAMIESYRRMGWWP